MLISSKKKKKIDDTKKHLKELMIEQILEKNCLGYDYYNNIEVHDVKKWNQRSMIHRIYYSMPSTTNSLESAHGHLNKKTPRRNNFWSSLYRVISTLSNSKNSKR